MKGMIYGVGVGPGDPELMTLKAVRLIRETDIIALPGTDPVRSVAYRIAVQAVPELTKKDLLAVPMPMIRDRDRLYAEHQKGAKRIEQILDQGKNIVFLTLGDVTVYCTFRYLQVILEADGYRTELVNGIPSFCAAAARLGTSLAEWEETLHIMPASAASVKEELNRSGSCVLMKSGSRMQDIKALLRKSGRSVSAVIDCGMESEMICEELDAIPDDAGYFSLIIAKEKQVDMTDS